MRVVTPPASGHASPMAVTFTHARANAHWLSKTACLSCEEALAVLIGEEITMWGIDTIVIGGVLLMVLGPILLVLLILSFA
jgi:hypothetical protein